MTENKCLFCVKGHCNSDYGKKMKCDGLNPSKNCPYLLKVKNRRK